ncbi:uncharacterized protein N7500_004215 [Penicillium coprophilum]|uniref:uncharacterized protein n=1 Tax=Penicillium coprophilum TaxID=36646 RepID=UPI0023A21BA8|nr:uncharacterized protein N7500_004215 [Penicillium coprophilum]KAJ5171432.1 hypothetical protein N7500_004215 [Penicillium coprophilum]
MNAFEMAALSSWSLENGPPTRHSTDEQIPGYEAHRQRQEARALMGSIAERRGKNTPAPVLIRGDAPPLSRRRRW